MRIMGAHTPHCSKSTTKSVLLLATLAMPLPSLAELASGQLSRQDLQALAKEHGVRANQKSELIILELGAIAAAAKPEAAPITEPVATELESESERVDSEPESTDATEEEASPDPAPIAEPVTTEAEPTELACEHVAMETEVEPAAPQPIDEAPTLAMCEATASSVPVAPVSWADAEQELASQQAAQDKPAAAAAAPKRTEAWKAVPFVPLKSSKPPTSFKEFTSGAEREHSLKSIEAANKKREQDRQREAASAARRQASSARQKEMAARRHPAPEPAPAPAPVAPAPYAAHMIELRLSTALPNPALSLPGTRCEDSRGPPVDARRSGPAPLPRVATLAPPPAKVELAPRDRFAGPDSIYNASAAPPPTAYDTAVKPSAPLSVGAFEKGSERFAGPDSIYNAPDAPAPTAYDATVKPSAPICVGAFEKRSERFAGPDSIYNAPDAPAPTTYDATVKPSAPVSVGAFEKGSERFAGPDSIYNAPDAPAPNAYETTVQPSAAVGVTTFDTGYADRFDGPDSRYRKGLRKSTMPVTDAPKVSDVEAPLPRVAHMAPPPAKVEITPRDRFAGPDSIYNAPDAPAPTAYDTTVKPSAPVSVDAFEKRSERFTGHDSIYKAPDAPAPTAYDTTVKPSAPIGVTSFDSGYANRFDGPDSRYRKGLRKSTMPMFEEQPHAKKVSRAAALRSQLTLARVAEEAPAPKVEAPKKQAAQPTKAAPELPAAAPSAPASSENAMPTAAPSSPEAPGSAKAAPVKKAPNSIVKKANARAEALKKARADLKALIETGAQ